MRRPFDLQQRLNFIVHAVEGEPIAIYGEGKQTRSFCYVDDLIDGLVRLMNSPDNFTGPVNLGNPGKFTILELAQKIIVMTHSKSELVYRPLPSDDPTQRKPDIGLAKRALGGGAPITIYGEGAHSATVEHIFRGVYTAAKTSAL